MATYNGEPVAGVLRAVQLEDADGAAAEPEFPPRSEVRVRGLALEDGETWVQIGASGGLASIEIVAEPARHRTRRGLRQALRLLRTSRDDPAEIAWRRAVSAVLLAVVAEVFGEGGHL